MAKNLKDSPVLNRRVNKYNALFEDVSKYKVKIRPDALFFIPEYGDGFNTDSLTQSGTTYDGKLTAREYFDQVVMPKFKQYAKDAKAQGQVPLSLDKWLKVTLEDYKKGSPAK